MRARAKPPTDAVPRRAAAWSVYILRCRDGSLYSGITNDLARRLERHAAGKGAKYTRSRLPVVLVHEERASSKGAALRREARLKQLSRAEKLAVVERGGATPARPRSVAPARAAAAGPRPRR